MKWSKTGIFLALVALVSAALFASCGSSPSAPDNAVVTSEPTAAAVGQSLTVADERQNRGTGALGTVYVTSQGLYYDTFVAVDPLPFHGRFQYINNGVTEFGPGDPGYLGGRWWEDTDGDKIMEATDHFFLCPLLPPGRPNP